MTSRLHIRFVDEIIQGQHFLMQIIQQIGIRPAEGADPFLDALLKFVIEFFGLCA